MGLYLRGTEASFNAHSAATSALERLLPQSSRSIASVLLCLTLDASALAQTADRSSGASPLPETVSWTLSAPSGGKAAPGARVTLALHGAVLSSWHVYGPKQAADGPTPMLVGLDVGGGATLDGAPTSDPAPTTVHDPSFNLDTQVYARDFTLGLPVRLDPHLSEGPKQIPVSVRFQTCNGETCRPPKTVHLTALINVQAVK